MHDVKFDRCWRFDDKGERQDVSWGEFLSNKHVRSHVKARERGNYEFSDRWLRLIDDFVGSLFDVDLSEYSLVHGDLHYGNVLIRENDLVLFDRESAFFSGDPLYDLAIAWIDMPNGSLIEIDDLEHVNDRKRLDAFVDGYDRDFTEDAVLKIYIVLIAFSRLYTPFAKNYKSIIENILNSK